MIVTRSLHRRFRLRYSLASLLVLFTLMTVVVGLYSASAQRQRHAVAQLQALGASVNYDGNFEESMFPKWLTDGLGVDFFLTVNRVHLSDRRQGRTSLPLGKEYLERAVEAIGDLPGVTHLYFGQTGIRDEELMLLAPLASQIETLTLNEAWNNDLTGRGFQHLRGWPQLRELSLYSNSSQLDLESLEHLVDIPALEQLSITGVLDEATFQRLAQLPRLKQLTLFFCRFDGRWLAKLSDAPRLKSILLHNCGRHFQYMGPYDSELNIMEPLNQENVEYMFHPGEGMQRILVPASPMKSIDLNKSFEQWRKEHMPGIELVELFSS